MAAQRKEQDAFEKIREYMIAQNRPYSAMDVMTNLRKEFGKTLVIKTLDALVASDDIKEKVIGKQKIFYANQDNFPDFDQSELQNLDAQMAEVTAELNELKENFKTSEQELRSFSNSLSTNVLKQRKKELQAECNKLANSVKTAKEASTNFSPSKVKNLTAERTKRANDILNSILENYPKKKKELYEDIGIETDEECGIEMLH